VVAENIQMGFKNEGKSIYWISPSQNPLLDETALKIEGFSQIAENEFYGNSPKISRTAIDVAIQLNFEASRGTGIKKDALPTLVGGIEFILYNDTFRYEFGVKKDGSINLVIEEDDEIVSEFINIDIHQAREYIVNAIKVKECFSSESYIASTGQRKRADLQQQHFPLAAMAEFPSYVLNVSVKVNPQFASTLKNTINTKNPYFGYFQKKSFSQNVQGVE
jgi:hypothetical protein